MLINESDILQNVTKEVLGFYMLKREYLRAKAKDGTNELCLGTLCLPQSVIVLVLTVWVFK
jgi:hypothetical protein